MAKFPYLLFLILIGFASISNAQKKTLQAVSVSESIAIDGKLDEEIWKTAPIATDFIMVEPDNGKPISDEKRTHVQVAYDNIAIYIAATCYDNEPDKILKEITQRDIFGTAEHFGAVINGFNDGQQDFRFFVSSAGVQTDCVYTPIDGEDFSWDAIWDSEVAITDYGWVIEIKIPYAGLRFPPGQKQTWGVNFYREIRRDRQQYTWNYIDTKIDNETAQSGIFEGIENIEPPTRLFFIPYSSYYHQQNKVTADDKFKVGMDIKYGINDSFTLDAILVPDFGQTRFDNVELNLTPFEQQFNENRPFFTEGTDLFKKGNLLYTRRIGGSPSTYPITNENEIVDLVPNTVNLINALKISGRTKSGLGIGILNAITEKTSGIVKDTITGVTRLVEVEPLANYNVIVLDQRFNKNSSVSLVNTNVTRNEDFRDANVTGLIFDLNTPQNTYNASGNFKYSYINEQTGFSDRKGYSTSLSLGETSGKYRYSIGGSYVSEDYDNNDLGINFLTNYHSIGATASYRIINPNKSFNTFRLYADMYTEFQNTTGRIQRSELDLFVNSTTLKNNYWGYGVNIRPFKTYDFYEARVEARFAEYPDNYRIWASYSPNYNKKLAVDLYPSYTATSEKDMYTYDFSISPRYRISDRILMDYDFTFVHNNHNKGWVDFVGDDIIFATRNRDTYINTLDTKFAINNKMTINLLGRYYWSYAENIKFEELQEDGTYLESSYNEDRNSNFNSWNIDLSYSWWFAPGSQLTFLYRNSAQDSQRNILYINKNFGSNFRGLFDDYLTNIFSISVRYFIDYNAAKNWF